MKKWVKGTLSIAGGRCLISVLPADITCIKIIFQREPERIVYDKEECYNRYIISLKELI